MGDPRSSIDGVTVGAIDAGKSGDKPAVSPAEVAPASRPELPEAVSEALKVEEKELLDQRKELARQAEAELKVILGVTNTENLTLGGENIPEFGGKDKLLGALDTGRDLGGMESVTREVKELRLGFFDTLGTAGKVKRFFESSPVIPKLVAIDLRISEIHRQLYPTVE